MLGQNLKKKKKEEREKMMIHREHGLVNKISTLIGKNF